MCARCSMPRRARTPESRIVFPYGHLPSGGCIVNADPRLYAMYPAFLPAPEMLSGAFGGNAQIRRKKVVDYIDYNC
jgi:hypothetical protein